MDYALKIVILQMGTKMLKKNTQERYGWSLNVYLEIYKAPEKILLSLGNRLMESFRNMT